jgi:hypothetical protein
MSIDRGKTVLCSILENCDYTLLFSIVALFWLPSCVDAQRTSGIIPQQLARRRRRDAPHKVRKRLSEGCQRENFVFVQERVYTNGTDLESGCYQYVSPEVRNQAGLLSSSHQFI